MPRKLGSISSDQFIKALKKDGWQEVGSRGDHLQFKHPSKSGKVTVQHPVKDIKRMNLASMLRQAEMSKHDLIMLLDN